MQISFASLTGYSLSTQLCQNSLQSLTDDKLELGSSESESFSDQLCTVRFHILRKDFCRKGFHSFSAQLCTESFEHWMSQPQLDLATSLSLQQLRQQNSQLHSAQLRFQKFSQKNLESFSEQLCRTHSQSLTEDKLELGDQLRQSSFQRFSLQLSRRSLQELIRQLDLVFSLSLASELGSRTYSRQLQTIHSESSSFEQRAFTSAALLGSTKLGHKQSRSSCTRSSTSASPTSPSKSTTSSLQTTLFAILLFSFLFTNSFINNIFLNISFWKNDVEANNQMCKTAWESAYNKQFQDNNLLSNRALATQLWQNELGMNLAERAAWNIQLFNHNRDNSTLELAEDQLANKKQQQNKTNNTASQQLGPQQLQQAHLQLPQLCRQQADTAISRQLSKKPLPATGSQTAAWPAATLTASFSLSKKELAAQQLHNKSFYNNQLYSIGVVEQQLAPTRPLHSKGSLRLPSCSRSSRSTFGSLMITRVLPNLALSFENLNFSNFSSNSLGSGTLSQLSAAILEKNFGQQLAENELQQNFSQGSAAVSGQPACPENFSAA